MLCLVDLDVNLKKISSSVSSVKETEQSDGGIYVKIYLRNGGYYYFYLKFFNDTTLLLYEMDFEDKESFLIALIEQLRASHNVYLTLSEYQVELEAYPYYSFVNRRTSNCNRVYYMEKLK